MKYKNLQRNKGPAPYEAKGFRSGFVLLFAVTLAALLLAIALGISNIALKEVKFGTSARDTNDAFFAADVGAECALLYDYNKLSTDNPFITNTVSMNCAGNNNISIASSGSPVNSWNFKVSGLGSSGQGCANVTVTKTVDTPSVTTINSKGYNIGNTLCTSSNPDRVERELRVSY